MKTASRFTFSGYQKFVITILALTQFTVILDFMVMAPLGDLLMKSLDMRPSAFAISVSAYAFSAGISGLLAAGFADRFDRKKLLLFFYCGFIIGTVFCGMANSYATLVAARIFTGLFGGVIGSISMAIVTDLFGLQQRGRVMGFIQMGFGASQVLGIPISIFIAAKWRWEAPFWMVALLGVLIFIAILVVMKPIVEHLKIKRAKSPVMHLWHILTLKNYRVCYGATALIAMTGFMLAPFSSSFSLNNLGISYDQLTLLMMVSGVASLFILPLVGRLSDSVEKIKIFTIALVATIVVVLIYTNLPKTPFGLVMVINILLSASMLSRMIPSAALVTGAPDLEDRGAFMSVNASVQQMAGGLGAALSGLIVTQSGTGKPLEHYGIVGLIVALISAVAWVLLKRVDKMIKHKSSTAEIIAENTILVEV